MQEGREGGGVDGETGEACREACADGRGSDGRGGGGCEAADGRAEHGEEVRRWEEQFGGEGSVRNDSLTFDRGITKFPNAITLSFLLLPLLPLVSFQWYSSELLHLILR